ncbi:MAG: CaiB/BaiF CoA transferase family protein [Candidatus Bathyarchaeia archaeon]
MQPFAGLRILELGHVVAGPFATFILGNLGAEVIKIERPREGDPARSYPEMGASIFVAYNAGKKSVTLNLKSPVGREILLKLVETADAVVENYSPGVMESLGLSYEDMRRVNPRIIYCSIKGFGPGPYRQRPAMEALVQSLSGFMSLVGEPGGPPLRSPAPIMDCSSGLFAALAVVVALHARQATGRGQKVEVALFETGALLMSLWLAYYALYNVLPERLGAGHLVWAPYGLFKASAGKQVFIGVSSDKHWKLLCEAFNNRELAEDPKFQTMQGRVANKKELTQRLEGILQGFKVEEIVDRLVSFNVPAAPMNTLDKVLNDEHFNASKTVFRTETDGGKSVKLPVAPIIGAEFAAEVHDGLPRLGEHTEGILKSLGYSDVDVETFKRQKCI